MPNWTVVWPLAAGLVETRHLGAVRVLVSVAELAAAADPASLVPAAAVASAELSVDQPVAARYCCRAV